MASLTGFKTSDSADNDSNEEMSTLKTKIDQLESSITKKVAEDIQSSIPTLVDAQVQKNLQAQLPSLLLKPMYKEFNAFNKLESHIFDTLQEQLSKAIKTIMGKSIRLKDLRFMFKDMVSLLNAVEVFKKANDEEEK
ncbi:hypothetical protein Tco_0699215 [Tanacetum coccineum]